MCMLLITKIKNKLANKKITNEEVMSMGEVLIGREIDLKRTSPYLKIVITEVKGLREINGCRFIELLGKTYNDRIISMIVSIPTYKKLYNRTAALEIDAANSIYVKDITND